MCSIPHKHVVPATQIIEHTSTWMKPSRTISIEERGEDTTTRAVYPRYLTIGTQGRLTHLIPPDLPTIILIAVYSKYLTKDTQGRPTHPISSHNKSSHPSSLFS